MAQFDRRESDACGPGGAPCPICGHGEREALAFAFADQPTVDWPAGRIDAHAALVRGVDTQPARQAIARAVIRMAEELDIDVIAEGIETAGERDFFVHEGVRLFQGVLFSRPLFGRLADTPGERG